MAIKKLSALIIAKDEEENIKDCLESVKWADEMVVVIDDRTQDKTAQIARKHTNKVFTHKFKNFGQQCQFALDKVSGDWVLKLDVDERVTPELKREILEKIQSPKFDAYHAYFRPVFLGKEFRKSNVRIQGTIRLFRREKGTFLPVGIHEKLTLTGGKVGVLDNEILHLSHRTISQTMEKFNRFSTLEAEALYKAGGRTNNLYMGVAPLRIFLKWFFRERYFLEGIYGFVYAFLYAYYYLLKHLKIWELTEAEKKK